MEFDRLASNYDAEFSQRPTARLLRERTHQRMAAQLRPGMAVLDLGCGTGLDAVWLAGKGAVVTAVDGSAEMLTAARQRIEDRYDVALARVDFNALDPAFPPGPYDLVLANFGALNAVTDWPAFAAWLSMRVRAGGWVGMAVMSRFCAWETVWQLTHFRPFAAVRRWRGRAAFGNMTVYYPTAGEIVTAMGASFGLEWRSGLGVFLPPSEMFGVVEARPALMHRLSRWDDSCWRSGRMSGVADHLWLEFRRA